MIEAVELAGFLAAHAIWCVSDGETLIPMLGFCRDGERHMERLAHDSIERGVEIGKNRLGMNIMNAEHAVLLYDSYMTLGAMRLDTIMIEIRDYELPGAKVEVGIPYSPRSTGNFRVHRPKIVEWQECEEFDLKDTFERFFAGVQQHPQGSKIWNETLDESK